MLESSVQYFIQSAQNASNAVRQNADASQRCKKKTKTSSSLTRFPFGLSALAEGEGEQLDIFFEEDPLRTFCAYNIFFFFLKKYFIRIVDCRSSSRGFALKTCMAQVQFVRRCLQ